MGDTVICPRIIWKVDLSFLDSISRSYSQSLHILKSSWTISIEVDDEWDEYKIFITPENPEIYLNVSFFVQCGVRDSYGTCRFETLHRITTGNLRTCCIWGAARRLLLEENLIQNNLLWIICTVEPESSWEACLALTDSRSISYSRSPTPCTDELINDLKYLLNYSLHYDVILECEKNIIKAHKNVLACRSRVFEGMFRSNTREALEGKVIIRETPFHIFEKVIRFIYTSEISFGDVSFACQIYAEADKYFIVSLKDRCKAFFKSHLCKSQLKNEFGNRVTDACRILYLAEEHSDIPLQCWAEDYLADPALLVTPEWKNFAENNPDEAIEVYFKLLKKVKLGKARCILNHFNS